MKTKTIPLIITIFGFLMILLSIYISLQISPKTEPLQTKTEISTPEAYISFLQWKLLDCQRRNKALQEVIKMERKEKKNENH